SIRWAPAAFGPGSTPWTEACPATASMSTYFHRTNPTTVCWQAAIPLGHPEALPGSLRANGHHESPRIHDLRHMATTILISGGRARSHHPQTHRSPKPRTRTLRAPLAHDAAANSATDRQDS